MAVKWRAVPKERRDRLRATHDEILNLITEKRTPSIVKEYFGIPWEELNDHSIETIERLADFYQALEDRGEPVDKALQITYTLGFLSGVRFALDEDHELE